METIPFHTKMAFIHCVWCLNNQFIWNSLFLVESHTYQDWILWLKFINLLLCQIIIWRFKFESILFRILNRFEIIFCEMALTSCEISVRDFSWMQIGRRIFIQLTLWQLHIYIPISNVEYFFLTKSCWILLHYWINAVSKNHTLPFYYYVKCSKYMWKKTPIDDISS